MKGDFTRNTFRPFQSYSRVLLQQGRVQLDADWNEQVSILLHHLRTITADWAGAYARPPEGAGGGFVIAPTPNNEAQNVAVSFGRCYVNGLLVENLPRAANASPVSYNAQPYWWPDPKTEALNAATPYFVYLDVWERLQTADDMPELRESALGGPDTAARAQIVWQIKVRPVESASRTRLRKDDAKKAKAQQLLAAGPFADWQAAFGSLPRRERGALQAFVSDPDPGNDPCVLPPTSRYRGENQLWRVEVHRGGAVGASGMDRPTFKVSSDNGSIVYPVVDVTSTGAIDGGLFGYHIELASLGRDVRTAIAEGDWVELVDERYALESADDDRAPDSLLNVVSIDADSLIVTVQGGTSAVATRAAQGLVLRRWDQRAVLLDTITDDATAHGTFEINGDEIKLDAGIHLRFRTTGDANGQPTIYRRGDYWLIPGREATGDIEWPADTDGEPQFQAPLGITHHYAPLAVIEFENGWNIESLLPQLPGDPPIVPLESVDEF